MTLVKIMAIINHNYNCNINKTKVIKKIRVVINNLIKYNIVLLLLLLINNNNYNNNRLIN